MKPLKLLVFLLVIPLAFHAQKTLTGLWTGTLSNDSSTVRKNQTFEIALTEYRGKVYGYSRMNFFVNDTLYYIVKRVKGNVEDDVCEVKDDEIITHNFPRNPDKGVKLISTFRRSLQDSIWRLDGDWKTTESKRHRYYSISGKISLKSEADITKSKIFPHLEELNLADDVAFYKESKKTNQEPIAKTNSNPSSVNNNTIAATKKEEKKPSEQSIAKTEIQKPATTLVADKITPEQKDSDSKTSIAGTKTTEEFAKKNETAPVSEESVAFAGIKKSNLPPSNLTPGQKKDLNNNLSKPETKNQGAAVKVNEVMPIVDQPKEESQKHDQATFANSTTNTKVITTDLPKAEFKISSASAAAFVQQRKTIAPQILEFKSDSLELKLYDNGEIDGDTVSILLNGEILLAKQGLKASAIKKTIYIQPGNDEISLVLYAENLGKYPPNTGLVIIRDGEDDYQIRFSADLQQNAAIILRRKK